MCIPMQNRTMFLLVFGINLNGVKRTEDMLWVLRHNLDEHHKLIWQTHSCRLREALTVAELTENRNQARNRHPRTHEALDRAGEELTSKEKENVFWAGGRDHEYSSETDSGGLDSTSVGSLTCSASNCQYVCDQGARCVILLRFSCDAVFTERDDVRASVASL